MDLSKFLVGDRFGPGGICGERGLVWSCHSDEACRARGDIGQLKLHVRDQGGKSACCERGVNHHVVRNCISDGWLIGGGVFEAFHLIVGCNRLTCKCHCLNSFSESRGELEEGGQVGTVDCRPQLSLVRTDIAGVAHAEERCHVSHNPPAGEHYDFGYGICLIRAQDVA